MHRRIIAGGIWGALIVSLTVGASTWAKPQLFRKISGAPARPQPASPAISWEHDLKPAYRLSAATGKPMLVVFGAEWCTYCKKLEAETIGHPTLAGYINSEFIPVHLDFDKDRRAAQVLEVHSLPMCVVLSPDADMLGSIEGYVKPIQFGQVLRESLDFYRTLREERAIEAERRK